MKAMHERVARYVLTYVTGPHLPEWWGAVFAIGYGTVVAILGPAAFHFNFFHGAVVGYFSPVARVFSLLVALSGLLGLHALHKRSKAFRMAASVFLCFAFLWLSIYYFLLVPTPWQGVWMYFTHATLEALVYLRVRHDLSEYWT
jgi:hypothetical protein